MKKILLFSLLLLLLYSCSMNEEQRRAWKHFWGIKEGGLRSQIDGQQTFQKETHQVRINQRPLQDDFVNPSINDFQIKHRLEKKRIPASLGEGQYEFVLK